MKRQIWTTVAIVLATVSLGAIPAHATEISTTVTESDPIDPPLYDETADGGTVRVNVVTENRDDLSGAASAGETLLSYKTLPLVTLEVDKSGLDDLAAQPGVVSVTEDELVAPSLDESVPLIGGDKAVAAGKTGKGSAIAVLDTGVATNHPFLKGRVTAEACFSPVDANYGATSLCGNGAATQEGTGAANSASVCADIAECDHGTHVAGIAAGDGTGLSGAPARGVAPGADIVAVQVFSRLDSTKYCGTTTPCIRSFTSAQIAGLEKVLALKQAGMPIVAANLSLGSASYSTACTKDARKTVIDSLYEAGVATVVAAGNNGSATAVTAPACVPGAVSVGATTDDDEIASFSNHGPLLDVLAPGNGIVSSVLSGYDSKSGTSMAAPHVAGAFAVLRQAHPDKTLAEREALLKSTGTPVTDEAGVTVPRIDVGKAVGAATPAPDPEPADTTRRTKILNDAPYAIPDLGTVQSPITVSGVTGNAPKTLQVSVDVTHDWLGEVKIDLVAPDGQTYALKATNGTDPGGTLSRTYTVDASVSPASGTWKLQVADKSAGGTGTVDDWALTFPTPFARTAPAAIPDAATLTSEITVDGVTGNASGALQASVNVTHQWLGEVKIDLVAPDGQTYALKATNGTDPGGTLSRTYTVDASATAANGTWKLLVADKSSGGTGTLDGWSLTFPSIESQSTYAVPDAGTLQAPITVTGVSGNAPKTLKVSLRLTHDWLGEVKIDLIAPNGLVYAVKATNGTDPGGTLDKVYTVDASASPIEGTWKLQVADKSTGGTGTLDDWALTF
ncbi:serine protease [Streptomyces sp. Act143]|uniref:proprotein convertase P-domain-containing protein n=1 Tax=Streptomyces sp. Act143 TaxID=2200760 RepID=UPI000D67DEB6|nr:proprotein convertase P-domain-containing protein [Streptomyces sp. Act143]PWI18068.1 serine protease [Streptomyces sp. Act143]